MNKKKWTAVGAASVLGLGIVAGSAAFTANAMPLEDVRSGDAGISPLKSVKTDGVLPASAPGSAPGLNTPTSATDAANTSVLNKAATTDDSAPSAPSANSAPSAASAPSANSAPSPISPASPVSVQSPASID